MAEFFNKEAEKVVLSRLLKNPSLRADIRQIAPADMSPEVNRAVLNAIDACIASGIEWSEFLVIDRLNSLGIKLGGVLEPGVYISSLTLLDVTDAAAIGMAKTIKKWTVRRELHAIGKQIVALTTEDNADKGAAALVDDVTAVFNDHVNLIEGSKEHEPVDLYATMPAFVNEETTFDSGSIPSPFPLYNDLYGYFDPQSIYCWIARMKVGKSSFAMSMFQQMALACKDDSFRALVLDTEMSTAEVQSRILSSLSGVKEFYIRHKLYKQTKYRHMKASVEKALDTMSPLWGKIEHLHIGGWSLENQISATRRWAHKNLRGSKRGIVALDYFKLNSSADFSSKTSRDILLGGKVDAYKCLIKDINVPLVAFAQANREGEDTKQGSRLSNSSVIGGSDMIAQFCSNIYLLEKLSAEERASLNQLTPESATHSLKLIAPRQLGPNELGNDCLVKYTEVNPTTRKSYDRWCENHLLLSFNQFRFSEVGTFKDVYERSRSTGINVQSEQGTQGPML